MWNSLNVSNRFLLLSVALVLLLSIQSSNTAAVAAKANEELSESADDTVEFDAREQAMKKLRHFLLTSSAEQRAAKREQQNLNKRKLIREYLDSLNNADSDHVEQMKKRIKTFCNSYEDLIHSDVAACG